MEEFFNHPAVQAAVLPFVAALAVAVALHKTHHLGLAVTAAFLCAAGFTVGFQFESLTAARKLVLAVVAAAALGALLETGRPRARPVDRVAVVTGVALAVLWVLQRILAQQPLATAALAGAAAIAWAVALLSGADRAGKDPLAATASTLMTGIATGALALFGASALLAQLGIAVAAGSGAVLLVLMVTGARAPGGWTLGLSGHVAAILIALLAVASAVLPWYCLLPIPLVPWLAQFGSRAGKPIWQRAILCSILAFVPAATAVVLARFSAGRAGG